MVVLKARKGPLGGLLEEGAPPHTGSLGLNVQNRKTGPLLHSYPPTAPASLINDHLLRVLTPHS